MAHPSSKLPTLEPAAPDELRRTLLALLPALALGDHACAQDAAKMQPRAYRVALDNQHLRVLEFVSRPGMGICGTGMHSHPAHLTVVMNDQKAKLTRQDGTVEVKEVKQGTVFWSEAETHMVENISGTDSRALIVELKSNDPPRKT